MKNMIDMKKVEAAVRSRGLLVLPEYRVKQVVDVWAGTGDMEVRKRRKVRTVGGRRCAGFISIQLNG